MVKILISATNTKAWFLLSMLMIIVEKEFFKLIRIPTFSQIVDLLERIS